MARTVWSWTNDVTLFPDIEFTRISTICNPFSYAYRASIPGLKNSPIFLRRYFYDTLRGVLLFSFRYFFKGYLSNFPLLISILK